MRVIEAVTLATALCAHSVLAQTAPAWTFSTLSSVPSGALGSIVADASGALFATDFNTGTMYRVVNGQPSVWATNLPKKTGSFQAAVDAQDNVYFSDDVAQQVDKVDAQGNLSRLGTAASPAITAPFGLTVDPSGTVFVIDHYGLRRIAPDGSVSIAVPAGGWIDPAFNPRVLAADPAGNIYAADFATIERRAPDGTLSFVAGSNPYDGKRSQDGAGSAASFGALGWMVFAQGQLYVTDLDADTVRTVTPAGVVTTLAGEPYQPGAADGAGGNARFSMPSSIAADPAGNVYVYDSGNNALRLGQATTGLSIPFVNPVLAAGYGVESSASVGLNQSVTLSAPAFGPGSVSVQWYKDGQAIPGATSSTVTLGAAQTGDTGSYSLTARNAAGSISAAPFAITVSAPPVTHFTALHAGSGSASLLGLTAGNGLAVAVGDNGTVIASNDGVGWTARISGVSETLEAVCYGNGQFVAVGDHGRVLRSADGTTWVSGSAGTTQRLNGVAYGGSQYVAVGNAGTVLTSQDGVTWTAGTSGVTGWLRGIAYNGNTAPLVWAAVGQGGAILQSADGITWSPGPDNNSITSPYSPVVDDIEAIFAEPGEDAFTGVGRTGLLLQGGYWYPPVHVQTPKVWSWGAIKTAGAPSVEFDAVTEVAGTSFAFGSGGTIVASTAAFSTWLATLPSGTSQALHAAITFNDRALAVGDNQTVVISDAFPDSRLLNLSALAPTSPSSPLTVGFVISGNAPKRILIRAAGPALNAFHVATPISDPLLTLFDAQKLVVAQNQGWGANAAAVTAAANAVFAFPYAPGSADAAIIITLAPGRYSANVGSASGRSGSSLVELYDVDDPNTPASHLANVSTMGPVSQNQALTVGFVVGGLLNRKLLIRGVGPSLTTLGVANAVQLPLLRISGSPQSTVGVATSQDTAMVGAFPLTSPNDQAVEASSPAGAYTAQVTTPLPTGGVALLEIYDVP